MEKSLRQLELDVLDGMARSVAASQILSDICEGFEHLVPGCTAGVTILDRSSKTFEAAIFPALSPAYATALRGIRVSDKPGSCALAVFEGRTVECDDVASDDRFSQDWKELSLAHGLAALVSIPAIHGDEVALGTFVVAYPLGRSLTSEEAILANEFARLSGVVLTYRRNQLTRDLIVGELQHRLRNLFSMVGAIAHSTLRVHTEPADFQKEFNGRLLALSRAHALALEARDPDLRQLFAETLSPFAMDHPVELEGPPIVLSQEAAIAFSLAAHELATNAAKYGALSTAGGSIHVAWELAGSDANEFVLVWTERGGPQVTQPTREGYGQRTLHRSLAAAFDGSVELDYRPEGFVFRVRALYSSRLGTHRDPAPAAPSDVAAN